MKVDDITYARFVDNDLDPDQMKAVKETLKHDNELDSVIQASIASYRLNREIASDLLGIEDIEEDFSVEKARISSTSYSIEENKQSLTSNIKNMKTQFTKEEITRIQELTVEFKNSYNPEITAEENLVNFYMTQKPGSFPEEAKELVKGMKNAINSFNSNLQQALSKEGFDYKAELRSISSNLSNEEKFELYVNFLAALQTLSAQNLSQEDLSQINDFQSIKEKISVNGTVTDEMLIELESQIADMLDNNTVCLNSVESLKDLISELPKGSEAVEHFVRGTEKDIEEKLITAMMIYLAYQNGELHSLQSQQLTPEAIAILAAAGVEEKNVMQDVHAGNITIERAIKVLKIIGGVALFGLLAYAAITSVTALGAVTLGLMMSVLGSSTIATIGALISTLVVIYFLSKGAVAVGQKVFEWSSRFFDLVVKVWREKAWPVVRTALTNSWNWLVSLFRQKTVSTQGNTETVQTNLLNS